jgi:hypothetical protein
MAAKLWCFVLLLVTMGSPGVEIRILNSVQSKAQSPQVVRRGQAVEIELRALRLSIVLPSGKVGYADVTMLSEPKTKLFWWFYQTVEQPDDKGILQSPLDDFIIGVADDKVLPDFFLLKGSAAPSRARIREVARMPGQWRLILDGPNKNSAEVILGDDYRLIRATVLPSEGR